MNLSTSAFLGPDSPVPIDRPFTRSQARVWGVTDRTLAMFVSRGLLLNPLHGVFHAAQIPDGLELRVACLGLVAPRDAVVTGRTAGWHHRAPMILAPGDHLRVPRIEMRLPPGRRLRNELTAGGERTFLSHEVIDLDGLWVTSKLRTTVDLAMGLPLGQAFAAMCAMAKVADFEREDLLFEVRERGRFAGHRGICQARLLTPYVDPRFGSGPECVLGLAWLDQAGMPPLTLQHPVAHPGGTYYLDLSAPEIKYGAEFNGPRWHGSAKSAYDDRRIAWLVEEEGWIIDVFVGDDLFGPGTDPGFRLKQGVERARRRFGSLAWSGQTRDGAPWLG